MVSTWPELWKVGSEEKLQEGGQQELVTWRPANWTKERGFPSAIPLPGMWM